MRGPVTWPVLFFLLAIVVKQSTQELANPCKIGINKQTFFPNPEDNTKYIQCTTWGQMFISSCPSGQIWKQETLTCMRSSVAELEKSINKAKSKLESSEPIVEQIETVKEAEPIKAEETSQIEAKQPEIVEQIQSSETVGEQLDKIETSHEKIEEQPHVAEIKESQEQSIQELKTAVNDQPSQEGGKTVLLKAKAKNLQLKVAPSSTLDLFKDSYELSHSSDSLASQSNRKQPSAKLLQFQQNMMQPQQQQMMSQMPQQQMMGQQTMMPQQQQQQMMGGQQAMMPQQQQMMPQQQGMASMGAGMGAGMGGMGAMGAGMGGMGAGMPGMGAMGGMPGGMPGMGAPGVPPMGGMPPAGPVGGPMVPPMAGAVPPMAGIPPVMPGVMPGMMPGVMPGMFGPGVFGAALAVPMYPALVGGIGFGFGGGRYYDRDRRRGNGRHDHDHDHDHDDDDDDRRHRGRPLSMNSLLKSSDSFVINNCAMVKCATGMVCAVASNCPTCNPMCFPPNDIRFETGVALGCDKVICPNDYHCIVNSTDQKLICLHEAPLTITENDIPSSPLPLESTSSLAPFIVNSCSNVKCSEEMICAAPTNCPTCNPMCFPPNKIQFEFGVHLSCEHIVCPTGFNCAQKADMENKLSCEPIHIATLETTSTTTPSSMIESVSTTTIMPSPVDTLTTTTFATPILTTTTLSPLPVVPSSSSNSFIVNSCNHVLCPLSMVCAVASNCPTCNPMCFPKDRIEFQFGARLSCSSIVCPSDSECGSEDGKLVCRKDQPIQQLIQPKQPVEASTLPVPVSLPLPAPVESSLPETKIQPKPVKSSAESFQVTKCENVLCPDNMVCATATNCLTCTPMCFPRNMIKFEFGKRPSCENVVCPFGFDCIPDSMDSSKLMCQSNDQMMAPMMSTTSTTTMASVVQPTTSTTTTTESTTTTTTTPSTTTTTTPTTTTTTTTSTTSTLPTTTTTSTLPMPSVVSPVANSDSFIVNNCQSVSCGDNLVCATASNCPDCNPMCFPPDKLFFQFGQHLTCRQVKCPTGFDCMVDTTNDKLTCVANKKKTINADVPVESMQQQDEQLVQPVSAETTTQSTSTTTARPSNVVIVNRCDMVNCGGKHVCATASNCDTCNPMCFPPGKLFFQFGVQVTCDTVKCPSGMSCFVDPADSIVKCRD